MADTIKILPETFIVSILQPEPSVMAIVAPILPAGTRGPGAGGQTWTQTVLPGRPEPVRTEAYLLILCVALAGFGLGASEGLTPVPMPFSRSEGV